jgi:hypothetical protein
MKHAPKEGDQAVEAEEHGRRAVDGQVGPLALGFDAQVGSALLKSRFQAPAFHKPSHDLLGAQPLVCRKQRFWGPLPLGITSEDPAHRPRVKASAIPQGSSRTDLQGAFSLPIPVQGKALPRRLRIRQDLWRRWPMTRGRPMVCASRSGGGSYRAASR